MPPLRERLGERIEDGPLAPAAREHVLTRLDGLPTGDALCHGDFHPDNVLRTDSGSVVIDWLDATQGHPAADIARSSLLLRFGNVLDGAFRRSIDRVFRSIFEHRYRHEYRTITGVTEAQIRAWELPVAAARLTEDTASERLSRWVDDSLREEDVAAFSAGGR